MALALHRLAMHSSTNTKKSNIYICMTFSGSEQERITLEKPSFMVTIYVIPQWMIKSITPPCTQHH